jgi:hypothetical protein
MRFGLKLEATRKLPCVTVCQELPRVLASECLTNVSWFTVGYLWLCRYNLKGDETHDWDIMDIEIEARQSSEAEAPYNIQS